MRVSKYRDVIRTTFFGRNDKNLNDATSIYNGFDRNTMALSAYQNTKKVRFDLNQEFSQLRIAEGSVIYLEFIRMPALGAISTCYKNLRVVGGQNINVFDSAQGSSGNPILFTFEGGNNANNYYLSDTEYSRLPIPPHFLNKGYIEFELDTILTGAGAFTAAQMNDLIIKTVIAEPDINESQDINLRPEYGSAQECFNYRTYYRTPLNH